MIIVVIMPQILDNPNNLPIMIITAIITIVVTKISMVVIRLVVAMISVVMIIIIKATTIVMKMTIIIIEMMAVIVTLLKMVIVIIITIVETKDGNGNSNNNDNHMICQVTKKKKKFIITFLCCPIPCFLTNQWESLLVIVIEWSKKKNLNPNQRKEKAIYIFCPKDAFTLLQYLDYTFLPNEGLFYHP